MEKAIKRYWPVFVLPTLIAFIIGFVWPFIWGTGLSFCKFTTVKNVQFAGLSNYKMILMDDTFTHAFWFTAAFTVVSTVLVNVLAFAIALLLTRGMRGTNAFRTIFFLPNLIGGIVLVYIWQILLNGILTNLGKPLLALDATYGFWGLIILMCWQQIGYMMIIYIAGLQNVPGDLLEAAAIDGATGAQALFKVKLPMVMPSITICSFLTLTNSFKLFDQNLSLTAGEPAKASQMLALNIYDTFYQRSGAQWKGIGQAKAVVFFLLVIVIALIQLYFTRRKEVQQ
ncbi:carbohydrate ABC transporter permease [Gemmiger sp.]|uniref:carbohydrate ABC transporter permease n=1 Tax=Gemmiger sp. TaxID=2049027 RepID=UPI003AB3F461